MFLNVPLLTMQLQKKRAASRDKDYFDDGSEKSIIAKINASIFMIWSYLFHFLI